MLIVSLTSVPQRVPFLVEAIQAICCGQTRKADKVVLYLPQTCLRTNESYIVPADLEALSRAIQAFEIRSVAVDYGPATKLVYALQEFPDDIVVTIDDDIEYHAQFLEELLDGHSKWPDAVLGLMGNDPPTRPFVHAEHVQHGAVERQCTAVQSLGGYRGILVPPRCINSQAAVALLHPESKLMQLHKSEGLEVVLEDDFFWSRVFQQSGVPMYVIGTLFAGHGLNLRFRTTSEMSLSLYNSCKQDTLRSRGLLQLFFK